MQKVVNKYLLKGWGTKGYQGMIFGTTRLSYLLLTSKVEHDTSEHFLNNPLWLPVKYIYVLPKFILHLYFHSAYYLLGLDFTYDYHLYYKVELPFIHLDAISFQL